MIKHIFIVVHLIHIFLLLVSKGRAYKESRFYVTESLMRQFAPHNSKLRRLSEDHIWVAIKVIILSIGLIIDCYRAETGGSLVLTRFLLYYIIQDARRKVLIKHSSFIVL
jgi:hypothetical protein